MKVVKYDKLVILDFSKDSMQMICDAIWKSKFESIKIEWNEDITQVTLIKIFDFIGASIPFVVTLEL